MPERAARTVLAFDFGLKRIGVAVGEPELATAHPLPAVAAFAQIEKLVAEWRPGRLRSEEHTSELQSRLHLVCRLLLEKKKQLHARGAPLDRGSVALAHQARLVRRGRDGVRRRVLVDIGRHLSLHPLARRAYLRDIAR